jgi:hypothetical protein
MKGITPGEWWADMNLHILNDQIGSVKIAKVSGATPNQARANAALISAAPDLLSALESARRWMFHPENADFVPAWETACDLVDKAILKAGGNIPPMSLS